MQSFAYANPSTVQEAVALLSPKWGEADVLAGGTDLLSLMKEHLHTPKRVVNIKNIKELEGIQKTADGIRIGALVTMDELAKNADVKAAAKSLAVVGEIDLSATRYVVRRNEVACEVHERGVADLHEGHAGEPDLSGLGRDRTRLFGFAGRGGLRGERDGGEQDDERQRELLHDFFLPAMRSSGRGGGCRRLGCLPAAGKEAFDPARASV